MGEHLHAAIEERFTVLRGRVGFRLAGRESIAEPGVRLIAPARVPHDWWNAGPEEALVRVEIRPAARFEALLKNAFGWPKTARSIDGGCRTSCNWPSSPGNSTT